MNVALDLSLFLLQWFNRLHFYRFACRAGPVLRTVCGGHAVWRLLPPARCRLRRQARAVFEQGGSAIDAAIAANAVLNVTEPITNGMGGDLFAIYWDAKTGKLYGLNASGWAPEGSDHRVSAREGRDGDAAVRASTP